MDAWLGEVTGTAMSSCNGQSIRNPTYSPSSRIAAPTSTSCISMPKACLDSSFPKITRSLTLDPKPDTFNWLVLTLKPCRPCSPTGIVGQVSAGNKSKTSFGFCLLHKLPIHRMCGRHRCRRGGWRSECSLWGCNEWT